MGLVDVFLLFGDFVKQLNPPLPQVGDLSPNVVLLERLVLTDRFSDVVEQLVVALHQVVYLGPDVVLLEGLGFTDSVGDLLAEFIATLYQVVDLNLQVVGHQGLGGHAGFVVEPANDLQLEVLIGFKVVVHQGDYLDRSGYLAGGYDNRFVYVDIVVVDRHVTADAQPYL